MVNVNRATLPPGHGGFSLIILSDLLWITDSHEDLVKTISSCLLRPQANASGPADKSAPDRPSPETGGRVIFAAGTYTKEEDLRRFFDDLLWRAGLEAHEIDIQGGDREWQGTVDISGADTWDPDEGPIVGETMEDRVRRCMKVRRSRVRAWVARWR
jgi:hypothetical protein